MARMRVELRDEATVRGAGESGCRLGDGLGAAGVGDGFDGVRLGLIDGFGFHMDSFAVGCVKLRRPHGLSASGLAAMRPLCLLLERIPRCGLRALGPAPPGGYLKSQDRETEWVSLR